MYPKFAVVGHPNKGKSTIVSALAMDDSIEISDIPGTTTKATEYPLKIDNKIVYSLIDTPGFQRPRQVLEFLKSKDVPATKRVEVLKEFIELHKDNPKFRDDIELLKPIINGAGVIYIVDASKPYSSEFELDMQILSYTGAESMAILNFIDNEDYSKEWKSALKHYFKLIKRFNPLRADINEYIDLLSAFGHLNEEWQESIKEAIKAFEKLYIMRIENSASKITNFIFDTLSYTKVKSFEKESEELKRSLIEEFKADIIKKENRLYKEIKSIWDHKNLSISLEDIGLTNIELFSKESEEYFGLSKKELITYSATVGAAIGAGVDFALLGHTFLLGAAIGGVGGAIAGYLGFDKLAQIKILGHKFGGKKLQVGPIKNINFAFVLLNRALNFTKEIAQISHAKRENIKIEYNSLLSQKDKKEFFKLHKKIIENKITPQLKEEYEKKIKEILLKELKGSS